MSPLFRLLAEFGSPTIFLLFFARTLAMLSFNPLLGGATVPGPIKAGLALTISLVCAPLALHTTLPASAAGLGLAALLVKEVVIGGMIGFLASLFFQAYALAGRLLDTQRGANMAETLVFQMREEASFLGQFLFQLSVAALLLAGGHRVFLRAYCESFRVFPVEYLLRPGDPLQSVDLIARLGSDLFRTALEVAGPGLVLLGLIDLGGAIVGRAAPRMNVTQAFQPARLLVGLWGLLLGLTASTNALEPAWLHFCGQLFQKSLHALR